MLGNHNVKMERLIPKNFFSILSVAIFFSVLQGLENILTIIEPDTSTRKYLTPLVDY